MRIAQLTFTALPPSGGQDAYVLDLKRVLEGEGHEVAIFQVKRHVKGAVGIRPLFGSKFPFWGTAASLPLKWKALKGFDLLICHYSPYLLPVACHRRTVLVSHGVTWDDWPFSPKSVLKRALDRVAFRLAWRVVANDTNFLRAMGLNIPPGRRTFEEVSPKVFFIPNCVDTSLFRPSEPDREISSLGEVLLAPRHLYRNRGVHLALLAFRLLARKQPNLNLVIIGREGQPRYVKFVKSLASRLGLSKRIHFLPPRPREEMPSVYSAALLTIVPSLAGEGTSLVALESMACGTPVVATEVGGLLDLPCVHAKPDPASLAKAVEKALRKGEELALCQRRTVLAKFTIEKWKEAWLRATQPLDFPERETYHKAR